MADQMLIQTSELALTMLLAMLILRARCGARIPLSLGSVGWHGGRKRR
jgi:hypothetical protein